MGSVTATPSVVKDGNGKEGCFFIFNDLSCHTTGSYRLMFWVVMISHGAEGASSGSEKRRPFLATVKSDIFNVYNAKEFPGVSELSALALSIKAQGCIKRRQVRNLH
ncbi:velvet factor [Stachybotrys elegans]|uniref:Velvet factor n=1 Tax=Stachybotrys elegans TaxID=80388 RepID=A0A8K0SA33_9HYPO|nr:velvet factor [Stachybotrys elegans]